VYFKFEEILLKNSFSKKKIRFNEEFWVSLI